MKMEADRDFEASIDAVFARIGHTATTLFAGWIAAAWMCGEIAAIFGRSRLVWTTFGLVLPVLSLACAVNLKTPRSMSASKRVARMRQRPAEARPATDRFEPSAAPSYV